MNVQFATISDLNCICSFYKELFAFLATLQPTYLQESEANKEFLKGIIEDEKSDILVAFENDSILGFAFVQEQETPYFNCLVHHKYAHLIDLFVEGSFRKKGVGTILINAVKEWAKERGLDYLELSVLVENTNAIKLYECESFQKVVQTMKCKI
jgi:ribosomal protein S18 acetylase RimI-like enzyme